MVGRQVAGWHGRVVGTALIHTRFCDPPANIRRAAQYQRYSVRRPAQGGGGTGWKCAAPRPSARRDLFEKINAHRRQRNVTAGSPASNAQAAGALDSRLHLRLSRDHRLDLRPMCGVLANGDIRLRRLVSNTVKAPPNRAAGTSPMARSELRGTLAWRHTILNARMSVYA